MRLSRPKFLANSAACLLAVVCCAPAWGVEFRTHGKLKVPEEPHTPRQQSAPKSPGGFNPDPGAEGTVQTVPHPKPRALQKLPDDPPSPLPQDAPKPLAPAATTPTGSPLDLGFPGATGTPLIPDLPPPPKPGAGPLTDRPVLFPEDILYLPRLDNEPLAPGLNLPRSGVRSQRGRSNIFHYREYPMGREGLGLLPHSEAMPNRWAIPFPKWSRYMDPAHETPYGDGRETIKMWHPYENSKLKGDAPIFGQDIFTNITLKNFSLFEYRKLPVPSGVSAATPNSSEFFGRGEQQFIVNDQALTVEFFKGETAFKPVEWLFRAQVVRNDNWIWVREQNLLDPDPRGVDRPSGKAPRTATIGAVPPAGNGVGTQAGNGTIVQANRVVNPGDLFNYIAPQFRASGASKALLRVDGQTNEPLPNTKVRSNRDHEKDFAGTRNTYRHKNFTALQELFFECHLGDRSENYDFISSRVGIQPFVSDFRGFIFNDTNLGVRIFGNTDNNRVQYNLAYFNMREKDTYSGLNSFDARDQQIVIANVYRQDFIWKGYTAQASLHLNFDEGHEHFDQNDFLVRPAPLGDFNNEHDVRTLYLGWAGDGHIGRLNITHAFYWVLGEDEANGLAGRRVDVNAQMAAMELSYDRDWLRFKLSGFWASGDHNPNDDRGTGFDSILDAPNFVGGPFSWYVHEGINLGGTAVNLKSPDSLIPTLRSSKTEGQSNFVNPGVKILGLGLDADVTPRLRSFLNVNYIWLDQTAPIESALHTNKASDRLGLDLSFGMKYRPILTDNIIVGAGVGFFVPDDGYKDIYRRSTDLVDGFGPKAREGEADSVLWNALMTVTLTF